MRVAYSLLCALIGCAAPLGHAFATPPVQSTASAPAAGDEANGQAAPGFTTGIFGASRTNLLADGFGLRPLLGRFGLSLGIVEVSELFGNATGGVNTGAAYSGLTSATLELDTQRAFGLRGGTAHISALQIHGRNLSADNTATLQTQSGIEATRASRLWEVWYEQDLFEDQLGFRIGQQSIDTEFITSAGSSLFINTAMGWPLIPSVDLYAGGPAYPLSSLGARIELAPHGRWRLLAGVFDDNPSGGPFTDDSQVRGAEQSGTKFHTGTGALTIAELQYALNQPALGEMVSSASGPGLPGLYKLGFWYDSATFPDQRFDTAGRFLADPGSTGIGQPRHGNWSIYAVADQSLWRPDPYFPRALGVFARVMGAPGDRNLADFSINAGLTLSAPLRSRKFDVLGVGFGTAKVSSAASALDAAQARFGAAVPVRSSETFLELTYQAQVAPWWLIQPDFQYVWTPGGGVADPNRPGRRIGNEAVFGARTIITF